VDEVSHRRPGQSFAFVMDTRWCDAALELADGVDLLVCESTFLDRHAALAERYRHMTALQAGTLARQARARRLVLTHFSARYPDADELGREARTVFDDVVVATDLATVPLPPRR
jgi:ribonuclease Z